MELTDHKVNDIAIMSAALSKFHEWGLGGFSKVMATFNHVGGSFNLFWPPPGMSE